MTFAYDQMSTWVAVNRHVQLEFENDVDAIMEAVGTRALMFSQISAEPGGGFAVTWQDTQESIRRFYEERNSQIEVLTSRAILQITSTYHVFMEMYSTLRDRPSGQVIDNFALAMLVPGEPAGTLVGECPWARHDERRRDPVPTSPADESVVFGRLEILDRYEAQLAAYAAGDADALMALCSPQFSGVAGGASIGSAGEPDRPTTLADAPAARAWYQSLIDRGLQVQRVGHACGEWYLYTDELWTLGTGGRQRSVRVASYQPLGVDGSFVARVAYAVPAESIKG